ncbi:MAG: tandem-95 repeat protein, partial [Nitrososphaeraceae archaeon]
QTNQAPEAEDQKVSVDANDKVKITLEGNDDDKEDKIQFDIVSDTSHGKLDNFDKSDGTVTYIPEQDYSGDDGFKFKVIDDKGEQSNSGDVEITVKSVTETNQQSATTGDETNMEAENQTTRQLLKNNESIANNQPPFAYDQDLSIHMNEKADISLTGKDDDNDLIQFAIVSNPTDASLDNFDTTKGTLTFVPKTEYIGNESFAFKVIDDKGVESNVATVSVEVSPLTNDVNVNNLTNQAPKALDQNEATDKNNQLNITLSGKDDDNDPIQFAIVSDPTDASLDNFDSTKGTLTFVPKTDYIGNESFAFKVIDDKGNESNVATVSVEVKENNQTNQAPLAFDQSTNESNSDIHKYVVWSAGEEEDRYILFARSTDGKSFSSPLSLSGSSRSNVFNPEASSSGNNIYVVWQGQSATGNQDIFLRKSSNYGASFSAAENISNDPGGSGNPDIAAVGNDTHITWEGTTPGNNFVFYTKSDNGSDFGTPQKLGGNQGISYRPEISVKENTITSPDSFTYKAVDDMGAESNVATVDVNLDTNTNGDGESNLKDNGKSVSIDSAHEVEITLKAKDQDKDPLQFEIITPPSEGRLFNFDPNSGTVKYIPNENNEIDINWHNYVSGHDRVLTKNIESSDTPIGKDNGDPFKSR